MTDPERWSLTHEGVEHTLVIANAGLGRRLLWTLDGEQVVEKKTSEEKVVLDGGDHGALGIRLPMFLGPARRVTWWGAEEDLSAVGAAHSGIGGIDFDPEPGSKAAAREEWIRAHPGQFVFRRTTTGVAKVVVPILVVWLLARFALPAIPWPDWNIPWPHIPWPNIPWPNIPWPDWSIPWPDWDLPALPAWVRVVRDNAKYVVPILFAIGLARAEVKRRMSQDQRKADADDSDEANELGSPA